MDGHQAPPRGLEQFPAELLAEILAAIDDLPSLSSATLASRSLHDAFIGAKQIILTRVLVKQLGVNTVSNALGAIESREAACDGCNAFLVDAVKVPDLLTINQINSIVKLSATVRAFSKLFVQSALDVLPDIRIRRLPLPSENELARIERAFYRFETFRTAFAGSSWSHLPSFERATFSFFDALAPWEVEQLGCIHDFLFHQIKPAYDDIASHDVVWGSIEVEPALNYASSEVQAIMSMRLARVYRIATAKTYAERHDLLYQSSGPYRIDRFLHQALKRYSQAHLQQQSLKAQSTPSREGDGDCGPQIAWEWAYTNRTSRLKVYRLDRTDLRRWGYVFWDKARLSNILLFNEPFRPQHVVEEHEVNDEFQASWRARERIARAGGTGYWSVTDQSQVVYPARRKPGCYQRGEPRVRSTLANAKRELEAASSRVEAAMQGQERWTEF